MDVLNPDQAELVREHLKMVLESRAFAGSKRAQEFLQLIVGHALDGNFEGLTERMIGSEMFGRPIGYDTGNDSVVRVKATEVRKKLAQFYIEADGKTAVRIELPAGSYVPRFQFDSLQGAEHPPSEAVPAPSVQPVAAQPIVEEPVPGAAEAAIAPAAPISPANRSWFLAALIAIVLGVVGYFSYQGWYLASNAGSGIRSIAILPLANLSGDPTQVYFADGMTEELITDLGQVPNLRVISMTSAMTYRDTNKTLPEIARELSVDGVVEGGVLRDGNHVRISVQLIDARSDRPIWVHTYVRDLMSVIAWQGEVAQAIAEQIRIEVTPQQQSRFARNRPIDPEAQDLYLHGSALLEAEDCKNAVDFFHAALDKYPNYAQAHAALAFCDGRLGESGRLNSKEAFSLQRIEAERAVELDPLLPEGHAELANADLALNWDWASAAAEFHRALELNPNSASIHQEYELYLVRVGQLPEALEQVKRSEELDPESGRLYHLHGFIFYFSHQYDEALSLIQKVDGMDIKPPSWTYLLGEIYLEKGRYADSIAEFLKSGDRPQTLGHLGNAYGRAGHIEAARRMIPQLEEYVKSQGIGRYETALVFVGMGDKNNAFKWLQEAYQAREIGITYLKIDPCLDPLRSDPRFAELLQRVGLAN